MNSWRGKRVLVTGGNGFVGSWLVKGLLDQGARVVVLIRDILPLGGLKFHGLELQVTTVFSDLTDYPTVQRVLNEHEIDTCFHLAAQALVHIANRFPLSTFATNIGGTWSLLEACRHSPTVQRVITASSDKAYGDQDTLPYQETLPLLGLYPYDASKACADILARCYHRTYGLPVAVVRCANIYGGGDLNFSRIIPDTIRAILLDQDPIIRSDGTPVRDYLYVQDAVDGYLAVAENLERSDVMGQAFNLGTERPVSVLELVQLILETAQATYLTPQILGQGNPSGQIYRQYLSSRKAKERLGWQPRYPLADGLRLTLQWYRAFAQAYPDMLPRNAG